MSDERIETLTWSVACEACSTTHESRAQLRVAAPGEAIGTHGDETYRAATSSVSPAGEVSTTSYLFATEAEARAQFVTEQEKWHRHHLATVAAQAERAKREAAFDAEWKVVLEGVRLTERQVTALRTCVVWHDLDLKTVGADAGEIRNAVKAVWAEAVESVREDYSSEYREASREHELDAFWESHEDDLAEALLVRLG